MKTFYVVGRAVFVRFSDGQEFLVCVCEFNPTAPNDYATALDTAVLIAKLLNENGEI